MKRLFLVFALLFLFLLLIVALITLNLSFVLNHPYFKGKLERYLEKYHLVKLSYEHISIDLVKLHFKFQDFKLEHPQLYISLPKAKVDFDWSKVLRGSTFPEEVYLSSPTIKVTLPKDLELKMSDWEFDYQTLLQSLAPIQIVIKNADLETIYGSRSLRLRNLNVHLLDRNDQLLFNLNGSSSIFSEVSFKGWLNHQKLFGEAALDLRNINLQEIVRIAGAEIGESILNLKARLSLEKEAIYAGFTGDAPCLIKLKDGAKVVCGYFQGIASIRRDGWEVEFRPVELSYPSLRGEVKASAFPDNLELRAKLQSFDLEDVRSVLGKLLPKEASQELFSYLKGGVFKDLSLSGRGKSWDEVFSLKSLKLTSYVKEGKVEVPGLPIAFEGVLGRVSLEEMKLAFSGEANTKDNISLVGAEVFIDLKNKEPVIVAKTRFFSDAQNLKTLAQDLVKDLPPYFKHEVKGPVEGSLNLSWHPESLKFGFRLWPQNVEIKTEEYPKPLRVTKGLIEYVDDKFIFQGLDLDSAGLELQNISGMYSLKEKNLSLTVEAINLDRETLSYLLAFDQGLKERLNSLAFDVKEIALRNLNLKEISFREGLREELWVEITKKLSLSGTMNEVTLKLPQVDKEHMLLFSPALSFSMSEGQVFLTESSVKIEDSNFWLSGNFSLETSALFLKGRGELKAKLYERVSRAASLPPELKLKLPAQVSLEELRFDQCSAKVQFLVPKETSHLTLNFTKRLSAKSFDLALSFTGKGSNLNLNLHHEEDLRVSLRGKLVVEDLLEIFESVPVASGKAFSDLSITIRGDVLKGYADGQKINLEFFHKLLKSGELFFLPSYLEVENLALKAPFVLTTSFKAKLFNNRISVTSFGVHREDLSVNGSFLLSALDSSFYVDGKVFADKIDLKRFIPKEPSQGQRLSKDLIPLHVGLPIDARLTLHLNRVVLPTDHIIERLAGNLTIANSTTYSLYFPGVDFCGLSFYVEAEKNPNFHYVYTELNPSRGDLLDLFSCLYPTEMPKIIFEGSFLAKGFFYFDGEKKAFENSYGKLEVTSHRGYMYRAPLLMRVFGFLSPIDLFRGKIPDLERSLLPYEELNFKAQVTNTSFLIDEFFMSAQGFRMFSFGHVNLVSKDIGITFLVSPFKTFDVIIELIPYLNKLLLGRERMFIYLPLEATGTYENPNIVPLHPASLGKGLFRFIFKFFGITEDFYQKKPDLEELKRKDIIERKLENNKGR